MRLCVGICTYDLRWQVMPAPFIISLVSCPTSRRSRNGTYRWMTFSFGYSPQPYILTFPISVKCKMLMNSLGRLTTVVLSFTHSPNFMRLCNMAYISCICSDNHIQTCLQLIMNGQPAFVLCTPKVQNRQ